MKDDKIIRFPNCHKEDDNAVHHIVLSSVLNDDDSNSSQPDGDGIDIDEIPPDPDRNYSNESPSEEDIIDVEFDDAPNPIDGIFSFLSKKMNKYFYMDKREKRAPKQKAVETTTEKEEQKTPSSIDIITSQIVDNNNVYIFEDLVRENNIDKLKTLFKNNDKLKNWVKTSYPIHRLSSEILDIIDGKEEWWHQKQAIVRNLFSELLACFFW